MSRKPIHGHTGRWNGRAWESPTYRSWHAMLNRCRNHRDKFHWKEYGGRGIRVCWRWGSFTAFLEDMGERPGVGYSIHRVDSDKGYTPSNCKWATRSEQQQNKRKTWDVEKALNLRGRGLFIFFFF